MGKHPTAIRMPGTENRTTMPDGKDRTISKAKPLEDTKLQLLIAMATVEEILTKSNRERFVGSNSLNTTQSADLRKVCRYIQVGINYLEHVEGVMKVISCDKILYAAPPPGEKTS